MTTEQQATLSKYGDVFQQRIVAFLFNDSVFCSRIEEILQPSFFELRYLAIIVRELLSYRKRFNEHPTYETMDTTLRMALRSEEEEVRKQTLEYFSKISEINIVDGLAQLTNEITEFCSEQALIAAIYRAVEMLEKKGISEKEAIRATLDDALNISLEDDTTYEYGTDEAFERRYSDDCREVISTGWDSIDKITRGGIGKGEEWVVIGSTGTGKSFAMVNMAAHAVRSGLSVLYVTLELTAEMIGLRFDSYLSGIHLDNLADEKERVRSLIGNVPGHLRIKKFPLKGVTSRGIRNYYEKQQRQGKKCDLICIDYADIIKPEVFNLNGKHYNYQEIYEDIKNFADETHVPIFTGCQTNRSGEGAELVDLEAIADAYSKCFSADYIMTLSQTIEEAQQDRGKVFIAKNRFGKRYVVFDARFELGYSRIKILSPTENPMLSDKAAKQAKSLSEKFEEFKKKRKGTN